MKRIISLLIAITLLVPVVTHGIPFVSNEIEKAEFEKCSKAFHKLISTYDNGNYVSDFVLDETDGIKIKGDDFTISSDVLLENCAENVNVPKKSKTVNKAYAEKLGYEVEINEDEVTLSQPYQTHRLIVKGENIDELDSLEIAPYFNGLSIIQFDDLESTLAALEYYKKQDNIEFANPDVVASVDEYIDGEEHATAVEATANSTSWGSEAIGFNTAFKWKMGLTIFLPRVYVAVVDTGLNYNHSQIKDRIIRTNYNNSYTGSDENEYDDNGHGTHVAGIIAQNTLGNVKIMGYKVLDSSGKGPITAILDASTAAYYDGAQVINLSLGAYKGNLVYDSEHEVYNFLLSNNVNCCVSAGNDGKDCRTYAPAQYEECITVAAMDENDGIPSWSNWGKCVDIIAPGVDISSADYLSNSGYTVKSGTSMATPFVTAAVADIISKNNKATPPDIKLFLKSQGRNINAPSRFYGAPALYLGNIRSFDMPLRPKAPSISVKSGTYVDSLTVSLTAKEDTEIYYRIFNYAPEAKYYSLSGAIKYTEPIVINEKCNIAAICTKLYPNTETPLESDVVFESYFFDYTNPEDYFEIDNSGTIIEYKGKQNDVYVPDTVNGIEVKAIGRSLFEVPFNSNNDEGINFLRTIRLPDTCTEIRANAFSFCQYLTTVDAKNIESLSEKAFFSCNKLENINLNSVSKLGDNALVGTKIKEYKNDSINSIPSWALGNCTQLVSVDLPNVKSIDKSSFYNCNRLKDVNMPALKEVAPNGFMDCGFEHISLPSVENIDNLGFYSCSSLKSIDVPNVTNIGEGAFAWCTSLETIDLHLVTNIEKSAFVLCESLKSVSLSNNLLSIGETAFKNCPNLTDVYFNGTMDEWERIEIGEDNEDLINANIHCLTPKYEIQSFDGTAVTLIDSDGNTTSIPFADYLNKYYSPLDVNDDGIVNAKDYAWMVRNF